MFTFITEIRPPALQRQQVTEAGRSAQNLFPNDKMWRSAFTIHVLKTHLQDYTRLGVADENFLLHGVELLVGIIIDETRQIEPVVFGRTMACLLSFLRGSSTVPLTVDTTDASTEQPQTHTVSTLIQSPANFVSRMIDVCSFFLRPSSEPPAIRHSLVELSFKALIEAFQRQPSVWHCFKENSRVVGMHQQMFTQPDTLLVERITAVIKDFYADSTSAEDVSDFYMHVGLEILPHTLEHPDLTPPQFFDFTSNAVYANRLLQHDEVRCRELCQIMVSRLQTYNHRESVELPIVDMTMAGLLKLFDTAIKMLQSFKRPLNMGDLAVQLFNTLLFPPTNDSSSRPLVDRASRSLVYQIVKATCEDQAELCRLLAASSLSMQTATSSATGMFPGMASWQRPAWQCSGLTNLGMTCYMNSLLQQLFANVHFRKFIFDTPIKDSSKQDLLFQVQHLFARMQNDYTPVADTSGLANSLGTLTQNQEDVHGFYEDFLSNLEANMPDDVSRNALGRFFSGTLISQIKGECGHVSPKTEPFVDLQMIVKNKATLLDSLQEFVQGEPMEGTNMYKCLSCDSPNGEGRLVNAMRRSCPENMPDNLTFCLKRFSFEAMYGYESKVNDRFGFPQTIDMARWNCAHLDDPNAAMDEDLFELVGVIVHQGSLQLGHYWSYTLLRNTGIPTSRTWVKLEDRTASSCQGGIEEIQKECFGGLGNDGLERADNAYVLFYQRKESLEESISLPGPLQDPRTLSLLPPKVAIPIELQEMINSNNDWRTRIAGLFDEDFHNHIMWLLSKYNHFSLSSPPRSGCEIPKEETEQLSEPYAPQEQAANDFTKQFGEVATTYLQRVATYDLTATFRLDTCVGKLKALIAAHPRIASFVLDQISRDNAWFSAVVTHGNFKVRTRILDLVLVCMASVRDGDDLAYKDTFVKIKQAHSQIKEITDPVSFNLEHYLSFAIGLGRLGTWEAASILDSGYLVWALTTLYVLADPDERKKLPNLASHLQKNPAKVTALFDFIRITMESNVVVPDVTTSDDEDEDKDLISDLHEIELKPVELDLLSEGNDEPLWMSCAKHAEYDWYVSRRCFRFV